MLKAIIIAAGEGTRMKSKTHKVLHDILGKPVLAYEIDTLKECGVSDIIGVIGSQAEKIRETFPELTFAMQEERLGTGHAVMMAKDFIGDEGDVLVLYGDTPLITPDCIKNLYARHKETQSHMTLTSVHVENPFGYGRIIRKNNGFEKIVEQKDTTPEEAAVNEINVGLYCFNAKALQLALSKLQNNNTQKEYYLTDSAEILLQEGCNVSVFVGENPDEFYGINTKVQLAEAAKIMQKRINENHMLNGVTIINPENTYIGPNVTIGCDTVIYPGTSIMGNTAIGEDTVIGYHCKIEDCKIGNNCAIEMSTLMGSEICNNVKIGPYAYIRPESVLMDGAKIGDFVEIKKAVIGEGTKANHLTYIGDAEIGKNVNFGCGTVVVNYDGKRKTKTVVCDNTFIGCNTNLISPVTVHEGAYVAAGSTITDDVPENNLAIARARQVNKSGWKKK